MILIFFLLCVRHCPQNQHSQSSRAWIMLCKRTYRTRWMAGIEWCSVTQAIERIVWVGEWRWYAGNYAFVFFLKMCGFFSTARLLFDILCSVNCNEADNNKTDAQYHAVAATTRQLGGQANKRQITVYAHTIRIHSSVISTEIYFAFISGKHLCEGPLSPVCGYVRQASVFLFSRSFSSLVQNDVTMIIIVI